MIRICILNVVPIRRGHQEHTVVFQYPVHFTDESGIVLESDHHGAENILRDLSRQGAPPPPSPDPKLTGE